MNLRRNSLANIVDTAFFMLGVSLISRTTVVPPLVGRLTGSKVAIGLAPALNSLGTLHPHPDRCRAGDHLPAAQSGPPGGILRWRRNPRCGRDMPDST